MEKEKLLFVYYKLWKPGGIARVLTNLVNELVDKYDITILILVKDTTSFYELDDRVKVIGIDSYAHWAFTKGCVGINKYGSWLPKRQNIKNYLYDFGAYQTLDKWLNHNISNYDLIIACQYKLGIQLASNSKVRGKSIAWEHTDHDVGGGFFNEIRNKKYKNLKSVVAINSASEIFYKKLNSNTFLIHNIIGEPFESVEWVDFKKRENIISFVGRLDKDKNVKELIEIFQSSKLNSNWKLHIIGDGPERTNLENYIASHKLENRIMLEGVLTSQQVAERLSKSKIFAFASLKEAFGNVLIEAMMCGNALIAYDCNFGPSDIINENNGFLIPMKNQKEFIEKLEFLTQNENELENLMSSSYKESKKWCTNNIIEKWYKLLES